MKRRGETGERGKKWQGGETGKGKGRGNLVPTVISKSRRLYTMSCHSEYQYVTSGHDYKTLKAAKAVIKLLGSSPSNAHVISFTFQRLYI